MRAAPAQPLGASAASLAFAVDQGRELNRFVRSGPIAAHLVVRSGSAPRLLVAFPAGDSGIAVWFQAPGGSPGASVRWQVRGSVQPIQASDAHGRVLRGVQAELIAAVPRLQPQQALLSSVRVLRDFEDTGRVPTAVLTAAHAAGRRMWWARERLDGAAGFRLSLRALGATHLAHGVFVAGSDGQVQLQLRALCGAQPLTPLPASVLLRPEARRDQRERDELAFLSYREEFLAGSWRFDTYFGRDTLIALRLLAPVLQPTAMASGIESVLARLSPRGEVAHEEAIGEYAILRNAAAGRGPSAVPIDDYGMIDEDFLLAPLVAYWLLDDPAGAARAERFLAGRTATGQPRGAALLSNLRFIVRRTASLAHDPRIANLIGLKPGRLAGDWRDSPDGLDGGRYPYDVNVALVPAALEAVARLAASGLLDSYLRAGDRELLAQAAAQRRRWLQAAPPLYRIEVPAAAAARAVRDYAQRLGLPAAAAPAALDGRALVFDALALDAHGRALPVMHSDESFTLLYDTPAPAVIERTVAALLRPFPAGLLTPVGLLIANPAYADRATQARFTAHDYHGTVIWGWQQALLAAGLQRQLRRHDLSGPLRARLQAAQRIVWHAIRADRPLRGAELWSWRLRDGHYELAAFQPLHGEAEADAAQLWSTVLLALHPPRRPPAPRSEQSHTR